MLCQKKQAELELEALNFKVGSSSLPGSDMPGMDGLGSWNIKHFSVRSEVHARVGPLPRMANKCGQGLERAVKHVHGGNNFNLPDVCSDILTDRRMSHWLFGLVA